ncbi:unnamed protein product [Prorocentrum cordatum]|uniref:Uncharacterized protein n=1 Tax=Prorocentrum cordatum TaxID=2364126 RepID=A0ABN9WPL1_9DINO|nr:unnamed protein product [Polarella glacialis]
MSGRKPSAPIDEPALDKLSSELATIWTSATRLPSTLDNCETIVAKREAAQIMHAHSDTLSFQKHDAQKLMRLVLKRARGSRGTNLNPDYEEQWAEKMAEVLRDMLRKVKQSQRPDRSQPTWVSQVFGTAPPMEGETEIFEEDSAGVDGDDPDEDDPGCGGLQDDTESAEQPPDGTESSEEPPAGGWMQGKTTAAATPAAASAEDFAHDYDPEHRRARRCKGVKGQKEYADIYVDEGSTKADFCKAKWGDMVHAVSHVAVEEFEAWREAEFLKKKRALFKMTSDTLKGELTLAKKLDKIHGIVFLVHQLNEGETKPRQVFQFILGKSHCNSAREKAVAMLTDLVTKYAEGAIKHEDIGYHKKTIINKIGICKEDPPPKSTPKITDAATPVAKKRPAAAAGSDRSSAKCPKTASEPGGGAAPAEKADLSTPVVAAETKANGGDKAATSQKAAVSKSKKAAMPKGFGFDEPLMDTDSESDF